MRYESHGIVAVTATCLVSMRTGRRQSGAYGNQKRDLVDIDLGEQRAVQQCQEDARRNGVLEMTSRSIVSRDGGVARSPRSRNTYTSA